MTALTQFDIEFFSLVEVLKKPITDSVKQHLTKTLLKLNNPTYYGKHVRKHPIEWHGYTTSRVENPVLVAISAMLNALRTESDSNRLSNQLQTEFAWAFNNFAGYSRVNL
jgi:hypothetical protein